MKKEIELFVPGRLCIMGEHSDWAGGYRKTNNKIEKGYAIVTGIEEGIYAKATISNKFKISFKDNKDNKTFESEMDIDCLKKIAEQGEFWSYAAGVAGCILEQYKVGGIEITITKTTIPIKKGLSSSAAICVLVTRAFNQLYNLHLNTIGEMNMAYLGEIETPSRCGRLDQACAFGKKPVLMTFDGDKVKVDNIKVGEELYFVFADLMAKKDTIKILADLNKCYPFATNKQEENVQEALGKINKEIIENSVKYIEKGNVKALGEQMIYAQQIFDKYVAPVSEELKSKVLHKTLNDEYLKKLSYGRKGVGSQGDGTVQFLAKDKKSQELIKEYLEKKLKMNAYTLTINKTKIITKAIIPVAGNGSRMYPITKLIRKAFLPIVDQDGIVKPALLILLEELDAAGIEKICLVIDRNDIEDYKNFFEKELSEELMDKLSPEMLKYEAKIKRIGKKLEYVYQDEKLGLGHAVSLCEEFAKNDEYVLLLLGDQLYKTNNNENCTMQLLNSFEKNNKVTVSVFEIPLERVSKYGILSGKVNGKDNYFNVDKMFEKPDIEYAKECLYTMKDNSKKYYSVFGEYIINSEVFKKLRDNINNNYKEKGEYELTSVLDYVREKQGMIAFIPDGKMLDIGNVESYKNTLKEKMN